MVEHLPWTYKALGSRPSMAIKEKLIGLMIWVHGPLSFIPGKILARAGEINRYLAHRSQAWEYQVL